MGSFVASYTVSQSANGTSLTITDTSNYTASSEPKAGFNWRRLFIYYVDGTPLVFPAGNTTGYVDFPILGADTLTITGFTADLALSVQLSLNKTTPVAGSVYTSTNVVTMVGFTNQAIYNAAQILASNPIRLSDPTFKESLVQLQREKVTAINAGQYGDQFSAQAALQRASDIISQSSIRF
jgi:hypothetical protein